MLIPQPEDIEILLREARAQGFELTLFDTCTGVSPELYVAMPDGGEPKAVPASAMATLAAFSRFLQRLSHKHPAYRSRIAPSVKQKPEPVPFVQHSLWDAS